MASNWINVDASLVVRLLVDTEDDRLPAQWREWHEAGRLFAAPSLLFYEVTNTLYQYQRHGYLSAETGREALSAALGLPIQTHYDTDLHDLSYQFAGRFGLSATYDAHYLALAEHLGGEFWTADRRLVRAVQAELAWVNLWPAA